MSGLIILLILVLVVPYLWRVLKPYIARWAQRRAENMLRRAMGMPPRDKQTQRKHAFRNSSGRNEGTSRYHRGRTGPLIPKEYAVDVDFTEIHSYSEDTVISGNGDHVKFRTECQVSDAEIIEIRKN